MRRLRVQIVLALLFAVVLVGGVVGEAAAQPEPTPIVVPGLAEAVAEADPDTDPSEGEAGEDEPGENDDGSGPSMFERALCGISPTLCATAGLVDIPSPGEALADLGEAAGESILDVLAVSMSDAVGWLFGETLGWWVGADSIVAQEQSVADAIGGQFLWISGALTVIGILWQAIRLMVTRSAQALADAGGALVTIAAVSSLGWAAVTAFSAASDAWARHILSTGIAGAQDSLTEALTAMPPAGAIAIAAVLFIASFIQAGLMVVREVAVVLMAPLMPFAAAARLFGWGRSWLPKIVNALISIILWKVIAASVLFGALTLFAQGTSTRAVLSGAAMLFLSIFILPGLMRIFAFHDVGGGVVSGGGGGRAIAAAGVIAAGAVMTGGASTALGGAARGAAAVGP